jgi:hypothetical protein
MRKFKWIGSFAPWKTRLFGTTHPPKPFKMPHRETLLAATSASSTTDVMPRLMNRIVGTRFKIIKGYPRSAGAALAMVHIPRSPICSSSIRNGFATKRFQCSSNMLSIGTQIFRVCRRWLTLPKRKRTNSFCHYLPAPPTSAVRWWRSWHSARLPDGIHQALAYRARRVYVPAPPLS